MNIFQVSKNKKKELKEKKFYIYDAIKCEEYLSKLYNIQLQKNI